MHKIHRERLSFPDYAYVGFEDPDLGSLAISECAADSAICQLIPEFGNPFQMFQIPHSLITKTLSRIHSYGNLSFLRSQSAPASRVLAFTPSSMVIRKMVLHETKEVHT
jgi:hypothetical protein